MRCSKCDTENKTDARFCQECGAPLSVSTPHPTKDNDSNSSGRSVNVTDKSGSVDKSIHTGVIHGGTIIQSGEVNRVEVRHGTGPITLWIGLGIVIVVTVVLFGISWMTKKPAQSVNPVLFGTPIPIPTMDPAIKSPSPTVVLTETPLPRSVVDQFDSNPNGWPTGSTAFIQDGVYRISGTDRSTLVWNRVREWDNFRLGIDLTFAQDTKAVGAAGILFRLRQSPNNSSYYAYLLSADGKFALGRVLDNNWVQLVPWTQLQNTFKPSQVNRLGVLCQDDTIHLLVNGIETLSLKDAFLKKGYIGLIVDAGMGAVFDNLQVEEIQ